jgi:hypothetical protein
LATTHPGAPPSGGATADTGSTANSMLSATPARSAFDRAASIAPSSRSDAWIGRGAAASSPARASSTSARQRARRTPATARRRSRARAGARCAGPSAPPRSRSSRAAERVRERRLGAPPRAGQHRGGERLAERRLGHRLAVAAPVQQRARRVGGDGAPVAEEPHDEELRLGVAVAVAVGRGVVLGRGRRCGHPRPAAQAPVERVGEPLATASEW